MCHESDKVAALPYPPDLPVAEYKAAVTDKEKIEVLKQHLAKRQGWEVGALTHDMLLQGLRKNTADCLQKLRDAKQIR